LPQLKKKFFSRIGFALVLPAEEITAMLFREVPLHISQVSQVTEGTMVL
jgi:hypothetical protein